MSPSASPRAESALSGRCSSTANGTGPCAVFLPADLGSTTSPAVACDDGGLLVIKRADDAG